MNYTQHNIGQIYSFTCLYVIEIRFKEHFCIFIANAIIV